jgi:hypothetical protein
MTHWNIVDQAGTIEILQGGGNYRFYATDTLDPTGLGVINYISIAAGATGDFTLTIDHPTAGVRGARQWNTADLRYAGGTCTITGIDVAEALRRYNPPGPLDIEDIFAEVISGNVNIGVLAPSSAGDPLGRTIYADEIHGNINIEGFRGRIETNVLTGTFTAGDSPAGRTEGDLFIHGDYSGTMEFNDPTGADMDIPDRRPLCRARSHHRQPGNVRADQNRNAGESGGYGRPRA